MFASIYTPKQLRFPADSRIIVSHAQYAFNWMSPLHGHASTPSIYASNSAINISLKSFAYTQKCQSLVEVAYCFYHYRIRKTVCKLSKDFRCAFNA